MRNMALCIPLNLHFGKKTCWFTACHIFSQKPNRRCNYAVGIKVISMSSQKHWGILRKRNLIADVFFPSCAFYRLHQWQFESLKKLTWWDWGFIFCTHILWKQRNGLHNTKNIAFEQFILAHKMYARSILAGTQAPNFFYQTQTMEFTCCI